MAIVGLLMFSGCIDTEEAIGTNINPTAVVDVVTGLRVVNLNDQIQFDASQSEDIDGSISSYLWDFGDGNTSTSSNPMHTYLNYGNYTVSLIATGPLGVDTIVYPSLINISTTNSCIVTLPSSGQGNTQTSCNGTLYDVGGPNGNYYDNCDSWITIEPAGATQVTLNFLDFDIEAPSSQTYCNWDYLEVFDGNSTSSPSLGQYCNSLTGSPGTITSTGGAITILLHADQSVNGRGFEVD